MKDLNIVGVGGSMNPNSQNLRALRFVMEAVATHNVNTTLFNVRDLDLPMYDHARSLDTYPQHIQDYIATVSKADGLILSTSAYHGTLAGITKNAIDFLEYLGGSGYLDGKAVGVLAVAGGTTAAVHSVSALVHSVHSLRGTVTPLTVPIPQAGKIMDKDGTITDEKWAGRMQQLAKMTVDMAVTLRTMREMNNQAKK